MEEGENLPYKKVGSNTTEGTAPHDDRGWTDEDQDCGQPRQNGHQDRGERNVMTELTRDKPRSTRTKRLAAEGRACGRTEPRGHQQKE